MALPNYIFITGFMGSGKTTFGKKLAALLKYDHLDLDQWIEENENITIEAVFKNEGEQFFRELETKYLKKIIKIKKSAVVSLGGGAVCFNDNLNLVKKNGLLIYIKLSPLVLTTRIIKSKIKRPLLKNLNRKELLTEIKKLLLKRKIFYEQAHLIINDLNLNPKNVAQLMEEYLTTNYLSVPFLFPRWLSQAK